MYDGQGLPSRRVGGGVEPAQGIGSGKSGESRDGPICVTARSAVFSKLATTRSCRGLDGDQR